MPTLFLEIMEPSQEEVQTDKLDTQVVWFHDGAQIIISYDNQDVEIKDYTFESNERVKTNDIAIIKKLQRTDSTPQMNLSGAKFRATLKSDRSKTYESSVTDESGYCVIENLPYGTYEIEEIVVPDVALKIDNFDVFVDKD